MHDRICACPGCQEPLHHRKATAKFCSNACKTANGRLKQERESTPGTAERFWARYRDNPSTRAHPARLAAARRS